MALQPDRGPNQTLLELIYALKGLAQTVEFYHKDLSQRLEEEAKARSRELDQLRNIITKNSQTVAVLPIVLSDRVEKLLQGVTTNLDERFEDVTTAVSEVRQKLGQYAKVTERAISQADGIVEHERDEASEVTGRIELRQDGVVNLSVHSHILKKIGYALLLLVAGGGVYGLKEVVLDLLGH